MVEKYFVEQGICWLKLFAKVGFSFNAFQISSHLGKQNYCGIDAKTGVH